LCYILYTGIILSLIETAMTTQTPYYINFLEYSSNSQIMLDEFEEKNEN
jgi:hypothetical protein